MPSCATDDQLVPVTNDSPTHTVHRDVTFRDTPERTLTLDVYEPAASGPRPTVVLFHGGAFRSGEKEHNADHARAFAEEGYVAVTPEYRLSDEATFPAALIDAKAAVEWCRAEGEGYRIDPQRIAAVGYSAGANLATLLSVTADEPGFEPEGYPGASSAVQAAVGWAGVYDMAFSDGEDPDPHVAYLGGTREEVPTAYELSSPQGQADVRTPPTLVVHGDADETLPLDQARRYAESVDAVGTGELVVLSGEGHEFSSDAFERTMSETLSFLSTHLASAGGRAVEGGDARDPREGSGP